MTYETFCASLKETAPPPGLPSPLTALWWDAKGNWGRAHEIAQDIDTEEAAWIHAYLHRKEGDSGNAAYWYGRAGKPLCQTTVEAEWEEIACRLAGG